jgi:hypothetical protein
MGRILIKGGSIISMDPAIKDLPHGDVLVERYRAALRRYRMLASAQQFRCAVTTQAACAFQQRRHNKTVPPHS